MTIQNEYGVKIDFDAAVNLMDENLIEYLAIHSGDEIESQQDFFDHYCEVHLDKFGKEFELAKPCPVY